ncbi:unnamed protein product [Prorocentrum cordatum]|uniref:Uncharacterized protein n=1 Tax=Prorocentrum cordatum TaxID=2364126 RepID=A0ABN9T132_9DINO|nr:unnamed protein product [Polarella glacialis]
MPFFLLLCKQMEEQLARLQEGLQAAVRRLEGLEAAQGAAEAAVHGQLGMLEADQGDLQAQGTTFGMRIEALEKVQTSHVADIKDLQKRLRREENRLNEIAQFTSVVQEDKISSLEEKLDDMQLRMDGKGSSFPAPLAPAAAPERAEGAPPPEQEGRLVAIEQSIAELSARMAASQDCGAPAQVPPLALARPAAEPDASASQQEKMTALERRVEVAIDELHSWIATQNRVATPRQGPATPRQTLGTPRMSPRDAGKPVLAKLPLGSLAVARGLSPLPEAERELEEAGAAGPGAAGAGPAGRAAAEPQGEPGEDAYSPVDVLAWAQWDNGT